MAGIPANFLRVKSKRRDGTRTKRQRPRSTFAHALKQLHRCADSREICQTVASVFGVCLISLRWNAVRSLIDSLDDDGRQPGTRGNLRWLHQQLFDEAIPSR